MEKKKVVSITAAKTKKAATTKKVTPKTEIKKSDTVEKKSTAKTIVKKTSTTVKKAAPKAETKTTNNNVQKTKLVSIIVAGVSMTFDPALTIIHKTDNIIEGNKILLSTTSITSAKLNQKFKTVNRYDDNDLLLSTSTSEITPQVTGKKMVANASNVETDVTVNEYNADGKLVKSILPGKYTKTFIYYAGGQLKSATEKWFANGAITVKKSKCYNAHGDITNIERFDKVTNNNYYFSQFKRNGKIYATENCENMDHRLVVDDKNDTVLCEKRITPDKIFNTNISEISEKNKSGKFYVQNGALKISEKGKKTASKYQIKIIRDIKSKSIVTMDIINNLTGEYVFNSSMDKRGNCTIINQEMLGKYDKNLSECIFDGYDPDADGKFPIKVTTFLNNTAKKEITATWATYASTMIEEQTITLKHGNTIIREHTKALCNILEDSVIKYCHSIEYSDSTDEIIGNLEYHYLAKDKNTYSQSANYIVSDRRKIDAPPYHTLKIYTKSNAVHVCKDFSKFRIELYSFNPKFKFASEFDDAIDLINLYRPKF